MSGLLPVAEAQARLLALAESAPVEEVPPAEATGRWAATTLHARRDQPAADLSAMDGYALRAADLPGPWTVIGEARAGGGPAGALGPREAARIFTGAALPAGADSVLMQEEAVRDGDRLALAGEGPRGVGHHVRARASDFAAGTALVAEGERWMPARIALAVIGGHGLLPVRRRPRVLLLSTGDELVPPGAPTPGTALPASNAPMLRALLAATPAVVEEGAIVPDRLDALVAALAAAAARADVVVTTGGASVGDHDLVRPALAAAGATLEFWRVAMRPGKPLLAGRLGGAVVLGLPGNPVSALVTGRLFLRPLVDRLAGAPAPLPPVRRAPLAAAIGPAGARADYRRAAWRGDRLRVLDDQDSAALVALAGADVLVVRPPHAPPIAAGESVDFVDLA